MRIVFGVHIELEEIHGYNLEAINLFQSSTADAEVLDRGFYQRNLILQR